MLVLAADGRRQPQTFSSADLAEEKRLALRASEMIRARQSAREATIGSSSRSDRIFKLRTSRSSKINVCDSLRVSAAKKLVTTQGAMMDRKRELRNTRAEQDIEGKNLVSLSQPFQAIVKIPAQGFDFFSINFYNRELFAVDTSTKRR